ncbi:MAG: MucR family transcriptional regulator [Pontixanthobacter sp.]
MNNFEDRADMLITLTSDIVAAHVSKNNVNVADLPQLIGNVHAALADLGQSVDAEENIHEPAVSVRASVKQEHLVCLECGRKLKMLKRHLMTEHDLTVADYRSRWELPKDYPMVAPEYAATRSDLAKKSGLGRKPGQARGRKKKSV